MQRAESTMVTVTIKIDNKIKMDRGPMNLRTAHQQRFIFGSRRKIDRGAGVSHSPCTLKNSRWMWLFLLKVFYDFPILKGQKKAESCYFSLYFALKIFFKHMVA